MNRKRLLKGTVIPVTMLCFGMLWSPTLGVQHVAAATEEAQQQGSITGIVVDSQGEPVIGASVIIVGGAATQGTVTDFDGNFTLKVKPGTKLTISYVGMKSQTVTAANGMKVTLQDDSQVLEGVEVVAYGVQKKVTVTGALSSVKNEDLVRTPVSSVNNVLAGQLSGVTTVQYSGEPGSDAASIFVRGKATWVDANPLIQVDGVERDMWDIDPNEIESITVLKDASATAVFGVRGANGVILITTKRGVEGKARITGSLSFSGMTPTKMIELANSYQYAQFHNQMMINDRQTPLFSEDVINAFKNNSDPIRLPSMDWADYIMKDITLQQQHNINISGGNKKVKYFISAGMFTQDGLFKQFGADYDFGYQYQRFNYRANIDLNVTKSTLLSLNVSGKVDDKSSPITGQGSSGMIKAIYQATPFVSPGIIDGKYIVNSDDPSNNTYAKTVLPFIGESPMTYYAYQPGGYQDNANKLSFDLILDQKLDFLTKGLSAKLKGSYNSSFASRRTVSAGVASYTPIVQEDGNTILYRKNGDTVPPSYSSSITGKGRDWYIEASANYNRAFGNHTISALALYNQSKQYYISGAYEDIPRTYVGLVGRVTYDWNNRYIAEFNVGYNGSENFAPGKRFGFFPAGSLGWVISDESFFKPLKKVFSFMKLRASWGLVGNDKISNSRFMYVPDPYFVNTTELTERIGGPRDQDKNPYAYNFGVENSTVSKGAVEAAKNNPDVSWEKAFKQDYGIDVNFLNDRLMGVFDYFREHRTNILLQDLTAPSVLGFTVPWSNLGEVDSWGWEASLNWNDKIGSDFRYWAKLNVSYNQNEIKEKFEAPQANEYMYERGQRIGSRSLYKFWKYYYQGAEADYEKEFGSPFPEQLVAKLEPGDVVLVDLDKNGKIDGNDAFRGNAFTDDPEYIAGLTIGFQYKGFSFNTQMTAAWNVTRLISDVFRRPFDSAKADNHGGLLQYHLTNTWTAENPSQDAEYPRATILNAGQNYSNSTLYEKDAKYFRVKTIQLAYDFNLPFMKKLGMNQLQLAISAYNLLTFTPYIWGDPETRASNAPSYPLQRTYTASLKVGF